MYTCLLDRGEYFYIQKYVNLLKLLKGIFHEYFMLWISFSDYFGLPSTLQIDPLSMSTTSWIPASCSDMSENAGEALFAA